MYSILFQIIFILGPILNNIAAVVVQVEQGLLEGEEKCTVTGDTLYNSFKGIPYAAPPTGIWRFRAPQPAIPWSGTRNASVHGNVCPQFNILTNKYVAGSEDCLFLNVYTPNVDPDALLPVMFYIHGGGYKFGSGNDDNYGPDILMDEKSVVMVTINYRLDALGFLCLDSEQVPGNAGMKDQIAALKWVQKNIEKFGGDPKQVTIFGQSAGASACTLHAISPMSKGLFNRVIAMSGVPLSEYSVEFESKRRAFVIGKSLDFETSNTTALLEFLHTLPVNQLVNTSSSIISVEDYIDPFLKTYFVPVVEKDFGQERFLVEAPENSVKKGRTNDVDILLGFTSSEGITAINFIESRMINDYNRYTETFVPRNIFYKTSSTLNLKLADYIKKYYMGSEVLSMGTLQMVNYVTDMFIHGVIRYARQLSKINKTANLYLYQFSSVSKRNLLTEQAAKYGIAGTGHGDELPYVFQSHKSNPPVEKCDISYKMIKQTCSLLLNFAIYGDPTHNFPLDVKWPQYDTQSERYLDIGENLTIARNPMGPMMTFWEGIYKRARVSF